MTTDALSKRPPTAEEIEQASRAVSVFSRALTDRALPIFVRENGEEIDIELPPALGQLMLELLIQVARGQMVTFVPYGAELTTQQAADLLNVSRPFLVSLLDKGEISHYKVGAHRRVPATELLKYKAKRDQIRSDGLAELQRLGQEFDVE